MRLSCAADDDASRLEAHLRVIHRTRTRAAENILHCSPAAVEASWAGATVGFRIIRVRICNTACGPLQASKVVQAGGNFSVEREVGRHRAHRSHGAHHPPLRTQRTSTVSSGWITTS